MLLPLLPLLLLQLPRGEWLLSIHRWRWWLGRSLLLLLRLLLLLLRSRSGHHRRRRRSLFFVFFLVEVERRKKKAMEGDFRSFVVRFSLFLSLSLST